MGKREQGSIPEDNALTKLYRKEKDPTLMDELAACEEFVNSLTKRQCRQMLIALDVFVKKVEERENN